MKSFDDYRKELTMPQLLVSANCCRHAFEAGQQSKQAEIDELQKRIDEALEAMDAESANSWGIWKEKACMYEQGAYNAYERSYWILKGKPDDQTRN